MGGDLAEKSSFTIVKCIAAECFLKWGRSCRKKQFYKSKTHRGRMFFELNRRVIFFTENLMGAMLMKIVILLRENESHMAKNWGGRCWWKSSFYWGKISRTWPKIQYFKNFLSRNDQILSTQRICQIYDVVKNLMGAMHQKIAIFKEENSVCRVQNFRISQNGTTF